MEKQTARIYLDSNVNVYETLRSVMQEDEFNKITIPNNRLVLCTEHLGEMGAFCLVGIALGLKVEYLIANSFFSPINVSWKDMFKWEVNDMFKWEVNGKKYEIIGAGFSISFEVP